MTISKVKTNRDKVNDYFSSFLKIKKNGNRVYVDMDKINNFHIFNQKYGVFHHFTEYNTYTGDTIFNVYVSPIGDNDNCSILSLLVKVNENTISNILTSLSTTDPRVKKKDD
jgi:hypothetical protein